MARIPDLRYLYFLEIIERSKSAPNVIHDQIKHLNIERHMIRNYKLVAYHRLYHRVENS